MPLTGILFNSWFSLLVFQSSMNFIHHVRIFRRSYRNLAWVGFEPRSTKFGSEALINWAIRSWVWVQPAQIQHIQQALLKVKNIWYVIFQLCKFCTLPVFSYIFSLQSPPVAEWRLGRHHFCDACCSRISRADELC